MSTTSSTAMKRAASSMIVLLGAVAFEPNSAAEEKLQKLSGAQIRSKIVGMELTDQVHWRELYERSGTVTSNSMGRKRTGKWRIEKEQLCIEFDKEPPGKCYDVWMSGKNVELRREGLLPLQGVIEAPGRK